MVQDPAASALAAEQHRLAFENAPIGIAVLALDGRFVRVNAALCRITGYAAESLLTKTFQDITHPDDLDSDLEQAARLLAGEIDFYQMEKRYRRPDGSYVWASLSGSIARSSAGEAQYFIAHVEDISDRVAARAALEHHALHDPLTGLANRQYMMQRLEQAMEAGTRRRSEVGVLLCDLNHLEAVNDAFGHEAGDRVLIEVAQRIKVLVRAGDTAARLGGDEFVVVCENITDRIEVFRIVERIRRGVEAPVAYGQGHLEVTMSIGVAFAATTGPEPMRLLQAASRDMARDRQRLLGSRAPEPAAIRLVIVDPAEVVRVGLQALCQQTNDLTVVAAVATSADAEVVATSTHPDIVLVDVLLPDGDGIDLCSRLRARRPDLACIVLSHYVDQEVLARAEQAGIRAYLSKDTHGEALIEVLRQAARAHKGILTDANHLRRQPDFPAERRLAVLSPRERQVAYLVGDHLTNRQIASVLGWTEKTTKNYMTRILHKLGMTSRADVLHLVDQAQRERGRSPTPPLPRHGKNVQP